jgi:hypothetical protein
MTSPLIGYASRNPRQPNPNFHLAYSEDGYRRKQSSGQAQAIATIACKPRANCLKPKEMRKKARSPPGASF